MHDHVHQIREAYPGLQGLEEEKHLHELLTYLSFWLSALYVVAEGFIELRLKDPIIESLVESHIDALRLFRNATFHFQLKPDKHVQFHDGQANRLNCQFFGFKPPSLDGKRL
jgi:hypothetical protein